MKVIGQGAVYFHGDVDERPHHPGPEELWQESWAFFLWDTDSNVYAFLRVSQVPNWRGGHSTVMLTVWTPHHLYRFSDDVIPLNRNDVAETSITAGNGLCRYSFLGN